MTLNLLITPAASILLLADKNPRELGIIFYGVRGQSYEAIGETEAKAAMQIRVYLEPIGQPIRPVDNLIAGACN